MFLDDMKKRRDAFRSNSIGHVVDFAITAQQAIDLMVKNEYDLFFLDHDLESEHYQSNEDHHEDGRFVARKMVETKRLTKHHGKPVIVHSLNPSGRQNIKSILKNHFTVYLGPEDAKFQNVWELDLAYLLAKLGIEQKKAEAPKEEKQD